MKNFNASVIKIKYPISKFSKILLAIMELSHAPRESAKAKRFC
jgi:hypothetical protein